MHDDYSKRKGSYLSQALAKIRSPLLSLYALIRKSPPVWTILNKTGKSLFNKNLPDLDDLQKSVLDKLMLNGIAFTSLDQLFPGQDILSDILRAADEEKVNPALSKDKPFLDYSLGRGSEIDVSNPLILTSISPRVLQIVNSYLEHFSKLIYFELAQTNLTTDPKNPMGSQRWHRDPSLRGLCKMFIYLSDVDLNSGPFTYVKESHSKGRLKRVLPQKQFGRHGCYPPDGAVEKLVPEEKFKVCKGKKGTVIFCDTTGLHKGGLSLSKSRIMYTSTYMPEGEIFKKNYTFPKNFYKKLEKLDITSRYAITDV